MIIREDNRAFFYLTWAFIFILLIMLGNALIHINQLKSDNAEMSQAIASMIDSQNQLIDKVSDEVHALKHLEEKLGDYDGEVKK